MTTIEGQALRSEDNGPPVCSSLQTKLVERTPEKDAIAEPSTKHGIEAVHFCVFAPPGSPLDGQSANRLNVSHEVTANNQSMGVCALHPRLFVFHRG